MWLRAASQIEHDLDGLGLGRPGGGGKAVSNSALAETEAVRDHRQHVDALVLQQAQAQRVLRKQPKKGTVRRTEKDVYANL